MRAPHRPLVRNFLAPAHRHCQRCHDTRLFSTPPLEHGPPGPGPARYAPRPGRATVVGPAGGAPSRSPPGRRQCLRWNLASGRWAKSPPQDPAGKAAWWPAESPPRRPGRPGGGPPPHPGCGRAHQGLLRAARSRPGDGWHQQVGSRCGFRSVVGAQQLGGELPAVGAQPVLHGFGWGPGVGRRGGEVAGEGCARHRTPRRRCRRRGGGVGSGGSAVGGGVGRAGWDRRRAR